MSKYRFEVPVSMPRGTHFGNNYHKFNSYKTGRTVTAFSNLERDNLIILEMDPEVEYFCEQPCKASLTIGGNEKETVFDVWVKYKNGREEFQEVKYSSELEKNCPDSRSKKQIALQQRWCMYHHESYVVRTDKDIYLGPYYIVNLEYMAAKVRRYNVPSDIQTKCEREAMAIIRKHYQTLQSLIDSHVFPAGLETEFISMMYYKGLICFANMETAVINENTEVYSYE